MSLDFLLEIGTEEIPHWMIPGALEQLSKLDLFGAKVSVDATPRRLVVWASGLPERTPDSEQVVKGPPLTSGDKAAEGFAKKQGADVSQLRKAGNYYELVKSIEGRSALEILAETLPAAILTGNPALALGPMAAGTAGTTYGESRDKGASVGLALSNGLVALSGALLAQYQGFSDVQMGIGMLVWGLASVIIGEALVGLKQLNLLITGALMGSVLFRLLVAIALITVFPSIVTWLPEVLIRKPV